MKLSAEIAVSPGVAGLGNLIAHGRTHKTPPSLG
jgi:hypothetical protein